MTQRIWKQNTSAEELHAAAERDHLERSRRVSTPKYRVPDVFLRDHKRLRRLVGNHETGPLLSLIHGCGEPVLLTLTTHNLRLPVSLNEPWVIFDHQATKDIVATLKQHLQGSTYYWFEIGPQEHRPHVHAVTDLPSTVDLELLAEECKAVSDPYGIADYATKPKIPRVPEAIGAWRLTRDELGRKQLPRTSGFLGPKVIPQCQQISAWPPR